MIPEGYHQNTCATTSTTIHDGPCAFADSFKLCSQEFYHNQDLTNTTVCSPLLANLTQPLTFYNRTIGRILCDGDIHDERRCRCVDISHVNVDTHNTTCQQPVFARTALVDVDTALLNIPNAELDLTPIINDFLEN
jgi:hypothetical protein